MKGQRTWPLVAENAAHSALNEKQIPKYFLHRFVRESIDAMDENTEEWPRPMEEIGTQDLPFFAVFCIHVQSICNPDSLSMGSSTNQYVTQRGVTTIANSSAQRN